ncbi:MAG: Nif3-like dinuclear metal center hexameric protein [Legionellales bacterium]|nr:Nif3-like dinuclear metal center hexameric protein [Legionellales bacterium]
MTRDALASYLADFLAVQTLNDYCPNGLQVAGQTDIRHIVTGVTACQALLDQAIVLEAEAVMVHHGYFWRGESPTITGYKHRRIASLLTHDINLFAYHLPLDVHAQVGNNAQLARHLQWEVEQWHAVDGIANLLAVGRPLTPLDSQTLTQVLAQRLQREPLCIISRSNAPIERIAWCTGAAQRYLENAANLGVDAYLTGEVSEQTTHVAREMGIDFFAAGHHATERYGIQALGEHLAEQFALKHTFIDIDNPV